MGVDNKMELLPCPFCGNPANIVSFRVFTAMCFYVKCSKCGAEINRPVASKKEALEAWNRRAENG